MCPPNSPMSSFVPASLHILAHTTLSLWQQTLTYMNSNIVVCGSVNKVLIYHLKGFDFQHRNLCPLMELACCAWLISLWSITMFSVVTWLQTMLTVIWHRHFNVCHFYRKLNVLSHVFGSQFHLSTCCEVVSAASSLTCSLRNRR